jgi:hypothetical protein
MILTSAPQNEAVLSNVGEIGEFRIRNSAKAFNILSSGLYSNKIKAVIRELSCNALDAHVAAGKKDTPFETHLPNALEPWFSVRDFGTGLNHEQVTSIYTTYFESTKTNSNDFVGGLGLGSKSPFSYTDNFTVTAIKDGRKGIYTAFINDAGVPSIALMTEEQCDEPNGVEVKFSVNERYDFNKFRDEARYVYEYFEHHPTILGYNEYVKRERKYETKDIIPGVHSYADGQYMGSSRAIMGNIPYPIEVPNAELVLGKQLHSLLRCGLEMHFDIGELDFQASREGLSYIAPTIAAIKSKLEAVTAQLAVHIATEADNIKCEWARSRFLYSKKRNPLWSAAITKYAKDTKFELFEDTQWASNYSISMFAKDLTAKYNINVRSFYMRNGGSTCATNKPSFNYDDTVVIAGTPRPKFEQWDFSVLGNVVFIQNDTKVGALERAKHHFREDADGNQTVFVLEVFDKTKPAKFAEFYKALHNPPTDQIMLASSLIERERATSGVGKAVNLMKLSGKSVNSWTSQKTYTWEAIGDVAAMDKTKTYYYIPLTGFQLKTNHGYTGNGQNLLDYLQRTGIPGLCDIEMYGVRKGDLETIQAMSNWKNIEDHIRDTLSNIPQEVIMGIVKAKVCNYNYMKYTKRVYDAMNPKSLLRIMYDEFKTVKDITVGESAVRHLMGYYAKDSKFDVNVYMDKYNIDCVNITTRYPILSLIHGYSTDYLEVANYVNLVEKSIGN